MFMAGQCAADKAKLSTNSSGDFEAGLECEEARSALEALWSIKSNELEKSDAELPYVVESSSVEWKQHFYSHIQTLIEDGSDYDDFGVSADDFFESFPECARDLDIYSSDDDESDSHVEVIEKKKPKVNDEQEKTQSHRGNKNEPFFVTSSSSNSPSPERSSEKQMILKTKNTIHTESKSIQHHPISNQQHFGGQNPSLSPQNNAPAVQKKRDGMTPPKLNSCQLSDRNPPNHNLNNYLYNNKNPYLRQNNPNQHRMHQYSSDFQGNQWQSNDNNTYNSQRTNFDYEEANANRNPFRTARELGKNFNARHGNGGHDNDEWDDYISTGGNRQYIRKRHSNSDGGHYWDDCGTINGNATDGRQRAGVMGGNNATSNAPAPQQLVRTTIRGTKDNLSAGLQKKFQPPMKKDNGAGPLSGNRNNVSGAGVRSNSNNTSTRGRENQSGGEDDDELPEELRGFDKNLIERINREIVDDGQKVTFDDIAGLSHAKQTINELILLPLQRPELFTGLRACPSGLLLFGPPGTGKTLIGKAIAHSSGATFFSISCSSLTSKWVGEGEMMVRAMYAVARFRSPAVIFIDEIDSMLTQRKADEQEGSRRMKNEFLVQLDGSGNEKKGQVLTIGATNMPHELDDAARRRFVKRLYVPLPSQDDREKIIQILLSNPENKNNLTDREIKKLARDTEGFSGSDIANLCKDAAMGPMRDLGQRALDIAMEDMPPITYKHFRRSLRGTSPTVAAADLDVYIKWNETYGSKTVAEGDDTEEYGSSEDESDDRSNANKS
mmetsp:Transcript_29983/g.63110  ORF Transcript_29983/g.63110 Transcript_29983/m.63110 type:complete len:779 (-) Transcript_29983:111-2447(-)